MMRKTRTAALELAFATKVVTQAFDSFTPVTPRKPSRAIAMLGFYQAGAAIGLIWCGLGGMGAIFLPQKIDKKSLNSVTVHL